MTKAIIILVIIVGFVLGTLLTLRRNAKTGMPPQDVLDRATQRARELDAQEKAEERSRDA